MVDKSKSLKNKLKRGEFVLGTWCLLPSASVVNVLAKAGLDFVIIDMEHGPIDFHIASQMVMATEAEDCEVIIRVPSNSETDILRALDIGASGVLVPHIESVRDREKAISYVKYPPAGVRGFSPYTMVGGYTSRVDHTLIENDKTLSAIILEGLKGIENIDKIIADKNLDLVYLGAYDLSVALGIPGDVKNPKVIENLERCTQKIRKIKKAAGALFHTIDELEYFKEIGIQFLCYKVDTNVLFESYNSVRKQVSEVIDYDKTI